MPPLLLPSCRWRPASQLGTPAPAGPPSVPTRRWRKLRLRSTSRRGHVWPRRAKVKSALISIASNEPMMGLRLGAVTCMGWKGTGPVANPSWNSLKVGSWKCAWSKLNIAVPLRGGFVYCTSNGNLTASLPPCKHDELLTTHLQMNMDTPKITILKLPWGIHFSSFPESRDGWKTVVFSFGLRKKITGKRRLTGKLIFELPGSNGKFNFPAAFLLVIASANANMEWRQLIINTQESNKFVQVVWEFHSDLFEGRIQVDEIITIQEPIVINGVKYIPRNGLING